MNFIDYLRDHQLSIAGNLSTSSLQSFIRVFSIELDVSENELIDSIESFFDTALCQQVLKNEYGPHSRLVGNFQSFHLRDFCPVLAMISSVAQKYMANIIIVCDDKNLSFLTRGDSMCVIQPTVVRRDPIIVALMDMANFRSVVNEGPAQLERFINGMDPAHILSLAVLESSELPSDESSDESMLDSDSSEMSTHSDQSEISDSPRRPVPRPVINPIESSKTLQSYLSLNFFDQTKENLIDPYTNNIRINVLDSDARAINADARVSFNKYSDLDGVFAVIKPEEFCDVIVSGGGITKPVKCANPKTLSSLRKHLFDSGMKDPIKMNTIKFGKLNDANAFELYAVASWKSELNIPTDAVKLDEVFIRAHNRAKQFQCSGQGCPNAEEHLSICSGRPDDVNQIEWNNFVWEYAPASFKCVSRDLSKFMLEELGVINGVELHFYVRLIGSKFTLLAAGASDFSKLLDRVADVFDLRQLAKANPPRAFIDACRKVNATLVNDANNVIFSLLIH